MINYYKVAKTAYCLEGGQWDCRCCPLCEYFVSHNYDAAACREHLIIELVKIIDEYKNTFNFYFQGMYILVFNNTRKTLAFIDMHVGECYENR